MLAMACNKDKNSSNTTWKAFSYNGIQYVSLQEAVDAATAVKDDDQTHEIVMIADYSGPGATVRKEFSNYLGLDMDGHRCELTTPLDLGSALSSLSGEGLLAGNIFSDNAYLYIDGKLNISGNLNISGTEAEESVREEAVCFGEGFTGSFKGNIALDNVMLSVYSIEGVFEINYLDVKGKCGMFNVDAARQKSVNVGRASSADGGHICTTEAGALTVASGEKPHVHDFVLSGEHSGTCTTPKVEEYICSACGYVKHERHGDLFGPCPVESLVHVEYVPASPTEGGNMEYWECPFCGKHYADAQGQLPILGAVSSLPGNYLGDEHLLRDLDDIFDWNTEFEEYQTKDAIAVAGIVLSVLGILETLGLSIPGLVADDGPKWKEVNDKLDKIQESLDRIEIKIDALAQKVDAVAYKNLIIGRNEKFNFLRTKSVPVFQLIDKYIKSNDADKKEKIAAAILDWSGNQFGGTHIADLTQSLMQQYVKTGLDANVPKMFEAVANCSYLWEHNGYNFRYQAIAQDVMLSGISYLLAGNFISSVKEYNNEDLRKADLDQLKKDFDVYKKAVLAELDTIKDRDGKYRRYNPIGLTFNRAGKQYDFRDWFEKHRDKCFPRNNYNNVAVNSCNEILKNLGLDKDLVLTSKLAKEFYAYYNRNNTVKTSIYTILRDSVGFTNIPGGFDPGVIFTDNKDNFGHENDDSAIPYYRIFHWESYRGSNNNDHFGIRTCLNNDCTESNHNILYYCDINSRDSGKINKTGQTTKWEWYTLVKAEVQQ